MKASFTLGKPKSLIKFFAFGGFKCYCEIEKAKKKKKKRKKKIAQIKAVAQSCSVLLTKK